MSLLKADSKDEGAYVGALLVAEFLSEFRAIYKGLARPKKSGG